MGYGESDGVAEDVGVVLGEGGRGEFARKLALKPQITVTASETNSKVAGTGSPALDSKSTKTIIISSL